MSRICKGCGGVLGRDCFNEIDCMEISRRQEMDNQGMLNKFYELESKIDLLENILIGHGIPLPYENPTVVVVDYDDGDWLPYGIKL